MTSPDPASDQGYEAVLGHALDAAADVLGYLPTETYIRVIDAALRAAELARADAATTDGRLAKVEVLVSDWEANGNSRELGDPTATVWFECANQLRDRLRAVLRAGGSGVGEL